MNQRARILLGLALLAIAVHVPTAFGDCLSDCQSNYPFPSDRTSPCCGCCNSSSSCHEIPELSTCCSDSQAFCGCLSSRAYCSGSIYNSSYSSTNSPFGTCYDPNTYGQCCYEPDPNVWAVCPKGSTCCPSFSYMGCCASGTECITTISDSYPICAPVGTPVCSSTNCGTGLSCCQDFQAGAQCYNPQQYHCVANDKDQTKLCPVGLSACGSSCYNPYTQCCVNGALSPISSSACAAATACGSNCPAGQHCCNGQCFNTANYKCFIQPDTKKEQLCPTGTDLCGTTCYDPAAYTCRSDGTIIPFAEAHSCSGVTCPSGQKCCPLSANATQCFDPKTQTCSTNPYTSGLSIVCGVNSRGFALNACGPIYSGNPLTQHLACYDPTQSNCCEGCSPGGCAAEICTIGDLSCGCYYNGKK